MQEEIGPAAMPALFYWVRSVPVSSRDGLVLVDQDTERRTVEIVELARANRPEKGGQRGKAEAERERDEQGEAVHRAARRRRRALATTSSEDPDIASAAISGVTRPAIASGTARTL